MEAARKLAAAKKLPAANRAQEYRNCQDKAYNILKNTLKRPATGGGQDKEIDEADFERIKKDGAKDTLRKAMSVCMRKTGASATACMTRAKQEAEDALGVADLEDDKFEELKEDAARDEVGEYMRNCIKNARKTTNALDKSNAIAQCNRKAKELAAQAQ